MALLALGRPKWVAAGNASKLVGMVLLIPLGYSGFGFPGAVVALACTELLHYAGTTLGAYRSKVACLGQDARFSGLVLLTAGAGLAVAHFVAPAIRAIGFRPAKLGTLAELLIITLAAGSAWGYAYLMHRRHYRRAGEQVAAPEVPSHA